MTAATETGRERAERTGEIAIASRNHLVRLHWLREPAGEQSRTVCGRYTFARHTGDERVTKHTPFCRVCSGDAILIRRQRHGF